MNATQLIEPITGAQGAMTLTGIANWLQGRTLYGGASALIAYTQAMRAFPDLPPLRAAQIGFVAPIGETVELNAEIVRKGRNVTQVRSEIRSDGQLGLTAFFLFAESREPNALHEAEMLSNFPAEPQDCEVMGTSKGPQFLGSNFELRRAQETSGLGEPIVRRWARLTNVGSLDTISQLILMGDVLPPGAMRAMRRQGPISSINWSFNLLDTAPQTKDNWWLAETASQHANEGYSSERLRLWNSDGQQVLDGLQSVAIFG